MINTEETNKSAEVLQKIRQKIDKLSSLTHELPQICSDITKRVLGQQHISIIVALYNQKYLQKYLKSIQTYYKKNTNEKIEQHMSVLYLYAYDCFLKNLPQFNAFFQSFKSVIDKRIESKSFVISSKSKPRFQLIRQLLLKYNECKQKNTEPKLKLNNLNNFVSQQLNSRCPATCLEECVYTYIRLQIEKIELQLINKVQQLQMKQLNLCCKLHFLEESSFKKNKFVNQYFEESALKVDAISKDHLRKYIVSYLNSDGGLSLFGFKHQSESTVKAKGTPMSSKQKMTVLNWMLFEILMKIHPPDDQQDESEQQQKKRMQQRRDKRLSQFSNQLSSCQQFYINKYIRVEFINLYDPSTWFYSRQNNEVKYIIRCKVQKGDQFELYLFRNSVESTQSYVMDNKQPKKLKVIEYYDELYKRLKRKQVNINMAQKEDQFCRVHQNQSKAK